MKGLNHIGQTFGRLTVIEEAPRPKEKGYRYWLCRCECGNVVTANGDNLRRSRTRSCGCLAAEVRSEVTKQRMTRHGMSGTYLHVAWQNMLQRCLNPTNKRYPHYGGRGVTACDRWRDSFEAFAADMGERPTGEHSLDRIDVNRGYEPGNCRWATIGEQASNTTRTRMHRFNGEEMTVYEASRRYGVHKNTIDARLKRGVHPDMAVRPPREAYADWLQQRQEA